MKFDSPSTTVTLDGKSFGFLDARAFQFMKLLWKNRARTVDRKDIAKALRIRVTAVKLSRILANVPEALRHTVRKVGNRFMLDLPPPVERSP
jgi:hypothetical protein